MIPDQRTETVSQVADSHLTDQARQAIQTELESICSDPQFSTSQRNCAFLRYVVSETLAGRGGSLKERILGKELFGRPINYDTGSDSVVRVRATEVRKRLVSYYDGNATQSGWRIHLPLRTYIPAFVPERVQESRVDDNSGKEVLNTVPVNDGTLPLGRMMLPTMVALFLCAATFRWQVFSGTPYLDFWETLLAGKTGIALILDQDTADPHAVTTDDLKLVGPILEATALLNAKYQVKSSSILSRDPAFVPVHVTHNSHWKNDRSDAYITVIPGNRRELWLESENTASLRSAVESISDSDEFPPQLQVALRRQAPSTFRLSGDEKIVVQEISSQVQP